MNSPISPYFDIAYEVQQALSLNLPVVALESTVITHGLPYPDNFDLAQEMERIVAQNGATPATVALVRGRIRVGLTSAELSQLAQSGADALKISRRDFAQAIIREKNGGTTVAGTLFVADTVGIRVFATGGIGGVHRGGHFDISTDLQALAETPVIVVCAGAKAILDLPATLEYLETMGVPVVGYQTDDFPAFYSRRSGLPVSAKLNSPDEIARFARAHWDIGMKSAILVANPIPEPYDIPMQEVEPVIQQAIREAEQKGIHAQALTPYLLKRLGELTENHTLRANLALLKNNAELAARIAKSLTNLE